MKSYESLKIGLEKLIPSIASLVKGIFLLVFWETPHDLYQTFLKSWKRANNHVKKSATIIAGLLVLAFLVYGFYGLWKDVSFFFTSKWHEQVLYENYELEIKKFFNKYNERYFAHDCSFMREVAADEAMFDKWGRTSYPEKNYSCEEFVIYQKKFIVPLKIEQIEKFGDRYRVKGEAIVIKINQGAAWVVEAMYFDLWRKLDWDLWHFNNPKDGPRRIPLKIPNL